MIRVMLFILGLVVLIACSGNESTSTNSGGNRSGQINNNAGQGGSLARFTIVDNTLYAIAENQLQLVNLEDPSLPVLWNRVNVQFGIETLFAYGDYLFIGSETGVFIYDNTNPLFPEYLSDFHHARSCDPVVVQGNYAFVTLQGGGRCWGGLNQLDILDVTNISSPELVKSYPMQEPLGLGIAGNKLFICDGRAGLKVFNVEDKNAIQLEQTLSDVNCYDVMPANNTLLVSSENRILQYSFATETMQKISEIKVVEDEKM